MTGDATRHVCQVRAIELADAVVREPGPLADGVCTGFVAHEAQGQVEAESVAAVAIVGNTHGGTSPVVVVSLPP